MFDRVGDIVRVDDHIEIERFAPHGGSGGGTYALALGAQEIVETLLATKPERSTLR